MCFRFRHVPVIAALAAAMVLSCSPRTYDYKDPTGAQVRIAYSDDNAPSRPPATKADARRQPAAQSRTDAFAVVIGIETYRQKLPAADFAANDATAVAAYLTGVLGYPDSNVVTLVNDRALRTDLDKYLGKWLSNNAGRDATVFIYFSGHGAPDPRTGSAYLVPYDGDPAFIEETGYPLERLYDIGGRLPAKEVFIVIDACFSGGGGRSVIAKGMRPLVMNLGRKFAPAARVAMLTASAGDQTSATYEEKRHGLFTYFLLQGMKGEADTDGDGSVSLAELQRYVQPNVSAVARKLYNNEQTPQLIAPDRLLDSPFVSAGTASDSR